MLSVYQNRKIIYIIDVIDKHTLIIIDNITHKTIFAFNLQKKKKYYKKS